MKANKKKVGLVLALTLCVTSIGILGSHAYFTDRNTVTNDFTTGSLDLKPSESLWDNISDGKNMYPGYTVDKNPTIQNVTGIEDNDAYVEALVFVKDSEGNVITDNTRLNLIYHMIRWDSEKALEESTKYSNADITKNPNVNPQFELVKRDNSKGMWLFYLTDTLKSASTDVNGESVTLFNTIAVPTDWTQKELDIVGNFQIEVDFRGIQSATFDSVEDAMKVLEGGSPLEDYNIDNSNRVFTTIDENTINRDIVKDEEVQNTEEEVVPEENENEVEE